MASKKAGKGSAPDRAPEPRRRAAKATSARDDGKKKVAARPVAKTSPAKAPSRKAPAAKPAARSAGARGGAKKATAGPAKTSGKRPTGSAKAGKAARSGKAATAERWPAKETPRRAGMPAVTPPGPETGLSEEDAIRSAKYTPRDLPPRLFEEERFLFPESYGVNRVRLLVRDPEWLFAYWDVSPASMKEMGKSLGERTLAVSRLTLRMSDPVSGGVSDILLPAGARWWYVRADSTPRSYKAELGLTLPSGEFRRLAESNTVVTPRVGPSPYRAGRRVHYGAEGVGPIDATALGLEDLRAPGAPAGPWSAPSIDGASAGGRPSPSSAPTAESLRKGGASDTFRPGGASDVHRR
jgi:uncharacterized protein DUF4912